MRSVCNDAKASKKGGKYQADVQQTRKTRVGEQDHDHITHRGRLRQDIPPNSAQPFQHGRRCLQSDPEVGQRGHNVHDDSTARYLARTNQCCGHSQYSPERDIFQNRYAEHQARKARVQRTQVIQNTRDDRDRRYGDGYAHDEQQRNWLSGRSHQSIQGHPLVRCHNHQKRKARANYPQPGDPPVMRSEDPSSFSS